MHLFRCCSRRRRERAPTDPNLIFGTADVFAQAAFFLNEAMKNGPGRRHLMIAYGMNSALSMELRLKCLLRLEGKTPKPTHRLDKLFADLNKPNRDAIRSLYQKRIEKQKQLSAVRQKATGERAPWDFQGILRESAAAFERFRYHFENNEGMAGWSAGAINDCIREHILTIRPDFDLHQYPHGSALNPISVGWTPSSPVP